MLIVRRHRMSRDRSWTLKVRLFLKMFFAVGIPSGVVLCTMFGITGAVLGTVSGSGIQPAHGAIGGVAVGLLAAVLVGAAMAAVAVPLHFSMTDDPNVRHQRRLVINASQAEARRMCIGAIRSVPNACVPHDMSEESRIAAKTGTTWRSWGDSITCDISANKTHEQTVVVRSRPRLRTTVVDYGSNLDNVERVVSYLRGLGAILAEDA